jgi:HSP20 family protein
MPLFFHYRLFPELLLPSTIFDAGDHFLEMEKQQVKYDISENDKEYIIEMDVPGFSHDEIVIECEADGTLTIKSEKKEDKEEKGENDKKADDDKDKKNVIVKGRNYHSFQYSFKFPSLDKVEATFKNSVLTVKIEKIKKPKRQIFISKL